MPKRRISCIMLFTNFKKAHSTLEYALVIGVTVAVLLTMQNYFKRSMQGKIQATSDEFGEHYAPGETQRIEDMRSGIASIVETHKQGSGPGLRTRTVTRGGRQTMDAYRALRAYDREDYWPSH